LGVGRRFVEISSNHVLGKERTLRIVFYLRERGCDMPQKIKKIKIFLPFKLLEIYFRFSKFEIGIFFPFMAILNFRFYNCNK
jgi:hypothetical protein